MNPYLVAMDRLVAFLLSSPSAFAPESSHIIYIYLYTSTHQLAKLGEENKTKKGIVIRGLKILIKLFSDLQKRKQSTFW